MVLYLNKHETNAGWGAENHFNSVFKELGVTTCQLDYERHKFRITRFLFNKYESLDSSILQRGVGYKIPKQTLKLLPGPGVLVITELLRRIENQSYMWDRDLFDYFFVRTPDCKHALIGDYKIPSEKIEILLSAYSPEIHFPTGQAKDIDILFVGKITSRRAQIIEKLNAEFGERFVVAEAFGTALNSVLNRAKIVLNIHGEELLDTETRVYECLGSGSFLISEKLSVESPFESGVHLVECKDTDEMLALIRHYLKDQHQVEREKIAEAGHETVQIHHTYQVRGQQIVGRLKDLRKSVSNRKPHLMQFVHSYLTESVLWFYQIIIMGPLKKLYFNIRTG